MTHVELLFALTKKLPRLSREEGEILKNIVSGIAQKGDSLFKFYEELTTTESILSLPVIKRISEKYSVPSLYKGHINERFSEFKKNIRAVCVKNKELADNSRAPGLDPDKWLKNKRAMFGSTEKITIENAGGIETICKNIHGIGYFDYLSKIFSEAATEVSRLKYSKLLQDSPEKIEYKK
jgi:hypothetical protein